MISGGTHNGGRLTGVQMEVMENAIIEYPVAERADSNRGPVSGSFKSRKHAAPPAPQRAGYSWKPR